MQFDNDNSPLHASDFSDTAEGLAARRAWLQTAPSTHAPYHAQSPVVTWAKREKDETTFFGLKLWRSLNEAPRMAANDNEVQDEDGAEAGERSALPNLDRDLADVSAKQLVYAQKNGMTRWVGTKLVKVWSGRKWVSPDAELGAVRLRTNDKADAENFDATAPNAQDELARSMDAERLRAGLGHKVSIVLDMASSDSTLAEIGEYLGFSGQYATRSARKEVRAAVAALNAALSETDERAA